MEGSVAAAGAAQGGEGEQQQGAEQQAAGIPSQLVDSLSAIAEGQNETREMLRAFTESQQGQGQGEGEGGEENDPFAGLDLSFLQETPAAAETENPEQFTGQLAQVLSQAVAQGVDQRLAAHEQQVVAPLRNEVSELRRDAAVQALADEFPQLADPETAQEVVGLAERLATANGQPELGQQPWFWRLTYMAAEAAAAANEAGGDANDPNAANLEGGGGALPGGSGGADLGDAIVGAKRGASVLPSF